MTVDQVNLLNIALMLLACGAAFVVPFELFLGAYAVLGPLHYLTQISWLHTRGYFTTSRRDVGPLFALCAVLVALRYFVTEADPLPWATAAVVVTVATTAAMALSARWQVKVAVAMAALAVAAVASGLDAAQTLLVIFLPTVIHVYVFTAAFILYGALRGRSTTGIASLAVFVACTVSLFVFHPASAVPPAGGYVRSTYELFADVNVQLAQWLGVAGVGDAGGVYASRGGVAIMRFIAFAYTYHYLNWFSKTSVIQWHQIPRTWAIANVVLWLASVALYAWDYASGLLVLFALSWLHVFLELPLDHRTFVGIGRELGTLVGPWPKAARSA